MGLFECEECGTLFHGFLCPNGCEDGPGIVREASEDDFAGEDYEDDIDYYDYDDD